MADNLPSASKMTEKSRIIVFIIIITIISIVSGTVVLLRAGALYRPQSLGFLGIQRWFSAPFIYLILNSVIISIAASPIISHSMLRILNYVTQRGYGIDKRTTLVGRGASQLLVSPPSAAAAATTTATTFSHNHFDQTWQDLIQDLTPPSLSPPLEVGEPIAKLWPVVYCDGTHVVQTMENPSNGREATGGATHVENIVDRGDTVSPLSTIANEENSTDSFEDDDGDETLEGTWRAIMGKGGAASPPSSMSSSESERIIVSSRLTSPRLPRQDALATWRELRKSETFNEAVSARQRGGLRRDPSLSVEDLNGRVETFIKNFNREMWLQRQESDQRFLEMINSGA